MSISPQEAFNWINRCATGDKLPCSRDILVAMALKEAIARIVALENQLATLQTKREG